MSFETAVERVFAVDLSTATVKRNSELEARVTELELELSVWKQAHAVVAESAERDKKAHNAQVSTLNRQISSLDTIKVSALVEYGCATYLCQWPLYL